MKKQIIFDMDGVILDTENMALGCWCFVAEKYNIPHIEETFRKTIGTNIEETKRILFAAYGDKFPYDMFREEYRTLFHERVRTKGIPVKAGARELLSFLKINGYRVGLASSTRRKAVIDELTQAGLLDFFETIVGGDMVQRSKPAPDIYRLACEEMHVEPSETYAIEDSWHGVCSAAEAGLKVLHVPDLLEPDEKMEKLASGIFEDLIDVRNYLARQQVVE